MILDSSQGYFISLQLFKSKLVKILSDIKMFLYNN